MIHRFIGPCVVLAALTTANLALAQDQKIGVRSRLGTASIQQGVFHCAVPGHPLADSFTPCNDIPVVVLLKEDGKCLSLVPYVELRVHTNRQRTRIVWRIYGSSTAGFDVANGIRIDAQAQDGTPQTNVFENKVHLSDRFAWVIRASAPDKKRFNHVAVVKDSSGAVCEEIDPVIVNVEN